MARRMTAAERAARAKLARTRARRALLDGLRAERRAIDLADAHYVDRHQSAPCCSAWRRPRGTRRGRSVVFGGVKFGLRFGIWRYVVDPGTGKYLVAAEGGWV